MSYQATLAKRNREKHDIKTVSIFVDSFSKYVNTTQQIL